MVSEYENDTTRLLETIRGNQTRLYFCVKTTRSASRSEINERYPWAGMDFPSAE